MQNDALSETSSPFADAAEPGTAPAGQDPAGGIKLSGRNRAGARARALAGMVLTTGLIAALNAVDTTSSMHQTHIL